MSNKSSNHFEHVVRYTSDSKLYNSTKGQYKSNNIANSQLTGCNGESCCNGHGNFISDKNLKKFFKHPI